MDVNQTWNTDNPELTECFQRTVLVWVPCLFLWVFSAFEICYFINSKKRNIPSSWMFYSKFVLTFALITLASIDLIRAFFVEHAHGVIFVTPFVQIITFVLALLLLVYNKKYGMKTSGLLFLFWLSLVLCGIIELRSIILNKRNMSYEAISYVIYYVLVVSIFLLNFLVDTDPIFSDYQPVERPCPEQNASFLSKITFFWFIFLALKGFKRPLKTRDFWSVNPEDEASQIVQRFEIHWKKQFQFLHDQDVKGAKTQDSTDQRKLASIMMPFCRIFGPSILFGSLLLLFQNIMVFVNPQILSLLIAFVSSNDQMWKGYLYSITLLAVSVVQALLLSQYNNRMMQVGLRMRTALIATIYKKSLRLSNASRRKLTLGEIVNLMSVDAQRFMDVMPNINMIWSAPLQIVVTIYFLWGVLGPSSLAGLATIIVLIPLNGWLAGKLKNLQIRQMKIKDERVKIVNEVLGGIKILKLYAWEPSFEQQILQVRNKEIQILERIAYMTAGTSTIWSLTPIFVSLVTFATYAIFGTEVLNSSTVFVSLALFNILNAPLVTLPLMISSIVQASVSMKRINTYMNSEELDPDNVKHDQSEVCPIIIESGNFIWDAEEDTQRGILSNVNLEINSGQLAAVVGGVGSGKSSLISALLGEMKKISGRVNTKGSIAYVPQQAWIQNATLKDNVLFGKQLDESLYDRVIEACALNLDLLMLPAGDETEIGEKGINLSGGQKQRVSLARALYSDSDIYLLDDPLSAVDVHVGKHIFDNVIGPNGMLKQKTRLLVTHGVTVLPDVDVIFVVKDGEISESGTYKELLDKKGAFADFLEQFHQEGAEKNEAEKDLSETEEHIQLLVGDSKQKLKGNSQLSVSSGSNCVENKKINGEIGKNLTEIEKTETGSTKWRVYWHYFKCAGWILSVAVILTTAISQGFTVGSSMWLGIWSNDNGEPINGTIIPSKQETYLKGLGIYGFIGICQGVMTLLSLLLSARGTIRASKKLFEVMTHRILQSPMSFFDSTPIGRILNRFCKDIDMVDIVLRRNLRSWTFFFFAAVGILSVISYNMPIFMSVILPISLIYYFIQRFYITTSRQIQRLESVSRSPIYSHFGESITGVLTIRAYGVEERFVSIFEKKVDFNQSCYYPSIIAEGWLTANLLMLGNSIIFFTSLFAVLDRGSISGGIVGLSVTYALQITQILSSLVQMTSKVETNIVAVERIKEYGETPQEAPREIQETEPDKNWPATGLIEFQDYKVRYREGLDLVLNGLSFVIQGGEKIGIVGRTGAGKSSLTLSLFRIIEAAGGRILIDGVDISRIGLHTLRSRLTIIPQDPILFSGSLRLNLDPFKTNNDEEIWRALSLAHLETFVQGLPLGLLHEISEGGENLSIGQRQLICLARALLRKTKILILDEATAAIDLETDDLIQKTIREQFKDCTVLTIAHRLNTIMDADRIIVLDNGQIIEFDSPDKLLKKTDSSFYSMAKDAGLTS